MFRNRKRRSASRPVNARKAPLFRRLPLRLEALEDRTVPALVVWTGDVDNLWGTNNAGDTNWAGDVLPQNGDDLLFPAVAANLVNINNLPGLNLGTITFGGTGYSIDGNILSLTTALTDNSNNGTNIFNVGINISGVLRITANQPLTQLILGQSIDGSGSVLTGGLVLVRFSMSQANTYDGLTQVLEGTLEVNSAVFDGAIPGNLLVGDNLGGTGTAVFRALTSFVIANSSNVTVVTDGVLDLPFAENVSHLHVVAGGSVTALSLNVATFTTLQGVADDTLIVNGLGSFFDATFNGRMIAILDSIVVYDAGPGNDNLTGLAAGSNFTINAGNGGEITSLFLFNGVENLTGRGGNDTFTFTTAGAISGLIDGGGGADTLDYSAFASNVSVNLGGNAPSLIASLNSDEEVPPQNSPGLGTATITNYNPATHTFDISVTVTDLNPATITGYHIHRAPFGVAGPIIVPLDSLFGLGALIPNGTGFTFNATNVPLPAQHEAAFLGGITYLNFHTAAAPSGIIRGQLFPSAAFVPGSTFATNTGSIANIENVTGGSGADSLVGNAGVNVLTGNAGNDTIVGAQGNDTMNGGDNDDVLVWSNGDNNDVMDGGTGNDRVQVNGAVAAGDIFTVAANGTRVAFQRTNLVPFALDIGTTETLSVVGIGGNDTMSVTNLAGVADLTAVNLFGNAGDDVFTVAPSDTVVTNVDGGPGLNGAGNNSLTFDLAGTTNPTLNLTTATSGQATFGNRQAVNFRNIQNLNAINGSFAITFNGTAGNDVFRVSRNGANLVITISTNGGAPVTLFNGPATLFGTLNFNGLAGIDQLIVDHAGGVVTQLMNFDGGDPIAPPGDSVLVQGGSFAQLIYTVTAPGAGSINLDGNVINFTGLEPVTVTSLVGTTTINENSGTGRLITLQDNATAGLNDVIIDGGLESLTFANPTTALIVNAGTGDDTVTLNALDAAFAAGTLTINAGDDQDLVQILAKPNSAVLNIDTGNGGPNDRTVLGNTWANFQLDNDSGSLANISGLVNVADSGFPGQVYIDDSGNAAGTTGTVSASTITVGAKTFNYSGMNTVQLRTGQGDDNYTINGSNAAAITTVSLNAGADTAAVNGAGVAGILTVNGDEGNDTFLVVPSPFAPIFINGGPPVIGDPGVPPGDRLIVFAFGATVVPFNSTDGFISTPGFQNINFTSIESLLLNDRFELNNTIATATFLGSPPFVTLDRLSILPDNPFTVAVDPDIDYFRYTAHDTGYLVINAVFTDAAGFPGDDLVLQVRDANDNILATMDADGVNGERLVIPVVAQQVYYIRVAGAAATDAANYNLEIENFPAPVPNAVDLLTASDSGQSDHDNITNVVNATIDIQADLSGLAAENVAILTAAQAIAGVTPGAAVQVFLNGAAIGFADVVPGTDNTHFQFTFSGQLLQGVNQITAAVRMFDVHIPPVSGRSLVGSPPLFVTLDTSAPISPSLFLNPPDDTGIAGQPLTLSDRITGNSAANFTGNAQVGEWVQLFVLDRNAQVQFIGTAQANAFGQYFIDPFIDLNNVTFFDLDGTRNLFAVSSDVAGNLSAPVTLNIFLDTRGPQVAAILINGQDALTKQDPSLPVTFMDILFIDQPVRTAEFLYEAVNQILATTPGNYALVGKKTGAVPITFVEYFPASIPGEIGQTAVRLHFGSPLKDDRYTLKIFDRIADEPFNRLDGDFFGVLPSGDGVPGGNFVTGSGFGFGAIIIDSSPELGFYANGSVNLDLNGDFIHNPQPITGEDAIVPYGPNGAAVFAGQFAPVDAFAVSGFDRLGTYGKEGGKFYFRLDFNDDADFNDPGERILSQSINGTPIAGRWDPSRVGDQVGLFTGTRWYLDTDGNNRINPGDTTFAGNMRGLPIAGDFDGDGLDDLATYQNGNFYFDFASDGLDGNTDYWFRTRNFPNSINGVASRLARPVAADFDKDGIDDLGLFIPNQTNPTRYQANWYFLISNDQDGDGLNDNDPNFGSPTPLDHAFSSNQFPGGGADFSATYGSSRALPVVGNFDPPVRGVQQNGPHYRPADMASIAGHLADLFFASDIDPFTGQPRRRR